MAAEVVGLLIIIGALIYILLRRRQIMNGDAGLDQAADKWREEMEQSADEIINRLAGHIDRLEELIEKAESESEKIERKISELNRLEEKLNNLQQAAGRVPPAVFHAPNAQNTNNYQAANGYRHAADFNGANNDNGVNNFAGNEFSRLLDATIENSAAADVDIRAESGERRAELVRSPEFGVRSAELSKNEERKPQKINYYELYQKYQKETPSYPEGDVNIIKPIEYDFANKPIRAAIYSSEFGLADALNEDKPQAMSEFSERHTGALSEIESQTTIELRAVGVRREELGVKESAEFGVRSAGAAYVLAPLSRGEKIDEGDFRGVQVEQNSLNEENAESYEESADENIENYDEDDYEENAVEELEEDYAENEEDGTEELEADYESEEEYDESDEEGYEEADAEELDDGEESEDDYEVEDEADETDDADEELEEVSEDEDEAFAESNQSELNENRKTELDDGWPDKPLELKDEAVEVDWTPPQYVAPLSESPTDEARRLLAAGYPAAEVARRVKLGQNAVELLQKQLQGKNE